MKNSSYKIQMLDNKYNNMMNLSKNDIQDEYIIELENQIKYRDELISENKIDLSLNPNIKTLELLPGWTCTCSWRRWACRRTCW